MTENPVRATVSLRGIIIGSEGEVLLVKRATDGGWELPGGRLDRREDPRAGLRRELAEETALDPTVYEPVHTLSWRNDADRGRFAVYYRCQCDARAVSLSDEHVEHEWVAPTRACARLSDPQSTGVRRALDADTSVSQGVVQ